MQYDVALDAHLKWWNTEYPGRSEITVAEAAHNLHVKPGKLTQDPSFPWFRDGKVFKVSVPLLARWQTDRAIRKK